MMSDSLPTLALSDRPTWAVVVAGIVSLAVAMGIGRFAFTPLLPLMLRDGTLDAGVGAEWAAANYAGYLVGALTASWFSRDPQRGQRLALLGVALSTLAIGWLGGTGSGLQGSGFGASGLQASGLAGAALRAAAGVFSAWALVCTSSWCLAELARRQAPRLGAWIYTGVGLGIAMAGMLAWLGGRQPAQWLWLELGLLALAGFTLAGFIFPGQRSPAACASLGPTPALPRQKGSGNHLAPIACYGILGFGYIVPATFLPAMAREQVADPLVFGLTWPLFGLAAALSVAAAARWLSGWPRRRVWALAHGVMALGTALPLASQALWSLTLSAVFVGGTFMVATMAGLQLARERLPANPTPLLARMTAAFAAGQIAGPLLVRTIGSSRWAGLDALAWSNAAATVLLGLTAALLWRAAGPSITGPVTSATSSSLEKTS